MSINMFLSNDYGVGMNPKRIRRIMKKYNLVAKIGATIPYK
ncbi:transposase (plasmid) [Alkalihalobacillus hwajinpoensis]|nr:transposase [Pseudalkalibacillus hwajinpoensis]